MSKRFNQFIGKAGHLHIMAEFLMRGWNVAIPEVDIGDDIFVVKDSEGTLRKVQVKTATANITQKGFYAHFSASFSNIRNLGPINTHYVFLVIKGNDWTKPVIIRQDVLLQMFQEEGIGNLSGNTIVYRFSYSIDGTSVSCTGADFSSNINNFEDFPIVLH